MKFILCWGNNRYIHFPCSGQAGIREMILKIFLFMFNIDGFIFGRVLVLGLSLACISCVCVDQAAEKRLADDAAKAHEALCRSDMFVEGWLRHCDPATGLIPRNLDGDWYWNAKDAAADNYPFMVLTSFFTDRERFGGKMLGMLEAERKYASRLGPCPDTYDFEKGGFLNESVDTGSVIFGSAEYMKDGLLPLTEWLGPSPWSGRMIEILDGLYGLSKGRAVEIESGEYLSSMPATEANGDLLQVLSRVYWMTGDSRYLEWAEAIGDYYLLEGKNRLLEQDRLRLRDHGGEVVLGLCELYATEHFANPEKQQQYKDPLYKVMDRILECGRNEHGMLYNSFNPVDGSVVDPELADTWGYIYDGFYTIYMVDGHEPYRACVEEALSNLGYYHAYDWEHGSHDGYADAIESALNLYNRIPASGVGEWIDEEMKIMFSMQQEDGVVEGWHGDGNFARTAIMYALWKSRGAYVDNWTEDLYMAGMEYKGGYLFMLKTLSPGWDGKLCFDRPRYQEYMGLPMDWTRINQFPSWFVPESWREYELSVSGRKFRMAGKDLYGGIELSLKQNEPLYVYVKAVK